MALEMKTECLDCAAVLTDDSEACICSFECTYCASCAKQRDFVCKNCGGDLQVRPKRAKK